MNYHDWLAETPTEIVNDPLWNTELYRLALFIGELAWYDAVKLSLKPPTVAMASQLYQAAGNISAHVAQGHSQTSPTEQAQFYSYAIGDARETRDWYFKAKMVLGTAVMKHRIGLSAQVLRLIFRLIPMHKSKYLYEEAAGYSDGSLGKLLLHVPMPE